MLAITFFSTFCALIAFWKIWRRVVDRISMGSTLRRVLVTAYWLLTLTVLGDTIGSLIIPGNHLTKPQFNILIALAFGLMPQLALFALVVTPVTMRGKYKNYSVTRALIIMESFAAGAIVMLAIALTSLLVFQGYLIKR
jgi:hypothetical protein